MRHVNGVGLVLRLVVMVVAGTGSSGMAEPGESTGSDRQTEQAVIADIRAWASQPSWGPKGRPLPLAHSWNSTAFGGAYSVEMIRKGHHVLPTMNDPMSTAMFVELLKSQSQTERADKRMREHWKPVLDYCNQHKLPLAMPGPNWGPAVLKYEQRRERGGLAEFSPEQSAAMLVEGKSTRFLDPFGPIERWRESGAFWMGNHLIKQFQTLCPDPPMVLMLDNHEGPMVRGPEHLDPAPDRFVALYGKGPHDEAFKARAIRKGYHERYEALFKAARQALSAPGWRENIRFSGYNLLWDTGHIGFKGRPKFHDPDSERAKTWPHLDPYDGAACEVYDNDWEPGKQDIRPYSMQTEAMSYLSVQDRVFARRPNAILSLISWDGGGVGNTWRGARREVGKAYRYVTDGQQWDFARYQGWVQFCLWMGRPRTFMEFRWMGPDPYTRDVFSEASWMAVVEAVDRVWDNDVLADYWRFGRTVPNHEQQPWWELSKEGHPEWMQKIDRWFLLTCDANLPRAQWTDRSDLKVWAMALERGDKPDRRWLLYAHAPMAAVAGASVALPGYGPVKLPCIPRSGSFFEIREKGRTLTTLHQAGPAQIAVRSPGRYVQMDRPVRLRAEVTCPPAEPITDFVWRLGDGRKVEQKALAPVEHAFGPGEHLVTVTGRTSNGKDVTGQTVLWTGTPPEEALLYDLSLDDAFAWRGPWKAVGEDGRTMMTYRRLPNRGSLPDPVISGGRFVDDPRRGRVLALNGNNEEAVWLAIRRVTTRQQRGHPNRTVSLWFRTDDVTARQVLFAEGNEDGGFNIYLSEGNVYAGAWAPKQAGWAGEWTSAPVEAGRWHHVALVLDHATDEVTDGVLKLILDGKLVASGPARRVPRPFGPPRLGTGALNGVPRTRFHDTPAELPRRKELSYTVKPFVGRIDAFRYANAVLPSKQ